VVSKRLGPRYLAGVIHGQRSLRRVRRTVVFGSLPAISTPTPDTFPNRHTWKQCPDQNVPASVDTTASDGSLGRGLGDAAGLCGYQHHLLGNSGRIGRSIRRAVSVAFSPPIRRKRVRSPDGHGTNKDHSILCARPCAGVDAAEEASRTATQGVGLSEHVLITGGAGFIGSHLSRRLLERSDRVRALDNLTRQVHASGRPPSYLPREVELIVGDVRDRLAVDHALQGIDTVVHLAARVGVGQSM